MNDSCRQMQQQIEDYLTGILPAEEIANLESHLSTCERCRDYMEQLQADDKALRGFSEAIRSRVAGVENSVIDAINQWKPERSIHSKPFWWRSIMKNRFTKKAIAAAIIIIGLLGWYFYSGSDSGSGVAWAEVVHKMDQIQTYTFHLRSSFSYASGNFPIDMPEFEAKVYFSSEYGMRMETNIDGILTIITYFDPISNNMTIIDPDQKHYISTGLPDSMMDDFQKHSFNPDPYGRYDPKDIIKDLISNDYQELGQKVINGIVVNGIMVEDWDDEASVNSTFVLWADAKTDMPVLMLMELHMTSPYGPTQIKYVMDDFQWDVHLDPSMFIPDIPEDYTLATMEMPDYLGEDNAIQNLRLYAEMNNGRYPDNLSLMSMFKEIMSEWVKPDTDSAWDKYMEVSEKRSLYREKHLPLFEEQSLLTEKLLCPELTYEEKKPFFDESKKLSEKINKLIEEEKKLSEEARRLFEEWSKENEIKTKEFKIQSVVSELSSFYNFLEDTAYYGATVTAEDKDAVLMRWKVSENEYRVIFGDLTVETVSPERLAELEASPINPQDN